MMKKEQHIDINVDSISLPGILGLPEGTRSLVMFAHGSGSSRLSPRNKSVAATIQASAIGTLLFDLLTEEENLVYENRFDIDLITDRLVKASQQLFERSETKDLAFGYFGASTGAAAALRAAVALKSRIKAVVSRGGRPDLAMDILPEVQAPTLLIVGGKDTTVIELNRRACDKLESAKQLSIVPGASHLFEEPGALEKVSKLAVEWFGKYLI